MIEYTYCTNSSQISVGLQGGPRSATTPLKNMESSSLTAKGHWDRPLAPRKPALWNVNTGDGCILIIVRQCLKI